MLKTYDAFLVDNSSTIATIESSLRSLTWFLPGRFKDAELASEYLTASLNVISFYHDHILSNRFSLEKHFLSVIPPTPHTRYTKSWVNRSRRYRWASSLLELIGFTQLLIEMNLRRKVSARLRWSIIGGIEACKAFLRIILLLATHRPELSPTRPLREFDPSSLPPAEKSTSTIKRSPQVVDPYARPSTPLHLINDRISISNRLQSPGQDALLSKALDTSDVKHPSLLMTPLASPSDWISELLYILRPFIYVVAVAIRNRNPKFYNPIVLSLLIEFVSRAVRRKPTLYSHLERGEYARRDRDLLWYFLRGDVWQFYTKPKVESLLTSLSRFPLGGVISLVVRDWLPLINEYHYYSS